MPAGNDWSGDRRQTPEERRKILERRRQERIAAADAAADAADPTYAVKNEKKGPDRRKGDRRREQVCFLCHGAFVPKVSGEIICADCQLAGVRGASSTDKSRF